jgi:hypothetical protein
MCSKISWCIGRTFFADNFMHMCSDLTEPQKRFIKLRYIRLVKNLDQATKRSALFYYMFSGLVTIGSIIVPSFISIQNRAFNYDATETERTEHSNNIYWSVWGVSIMVTFSNAFIKLLRLDQTYISRNLRLNQLKSEGIMFSTRTGHYKTPNTEDRFTRFVDSIEKLKNLQMHQEFTQNTEFNREPNDFIENFDTYIRLAEETDL